MLTSLIYFLTNHSPLLYLTQSIWRDEGFSFFMAKPSLIQIILNSVNDFNPPLYYLLLHLWMKIFGVSDIALRMMSFTFHILATYFAFLLAKKLFEEKFAFLVSAFTFLNPMLLYYGFELRMYSLYALFTVASFYYLLEKRWKLYIIAATLGIYTHSFFLLVIFSHIVYLFTTKQLKKKTFFTVIKPLLFYLPWVPFVIWQFLQSSNTWIFPVDLQLIKSALGNLFSGYEGTPGNLWGTTSLLSLLILLFVYLGVRKQTKNSLLFAITLILPLSLILFYSATRRPIYVNRYLIFVTVSEIFAIAYGAWSFSSKKLRYIVMSMFILLSLYINNAAVDFHRKVDIRSTIMEISKIAKKEDLVYAESPLVYFESAFYYTNHNQVYIYNPQNIKVPKYIGTAVIPETRSKVEFPEPPTRTFLVKTDGTFEMIVKTPVQ